MSTIGPWRACGRAWCESLFLHQQAIDTTTPSGRAMFQMLGVFAEFERSMIQERIRAGLARAKEQGVTLGRRRVVCDERGILKVLRGGQYSGIFGRINSLNQWVSHEFPKNRNREYSWLNREILTRNRESIILGAPVARDLAADRQPGGAINPAIEWETHDHKDQTHGPTAAELHFFTRHKARHVSQGAGLRRRHRLR